MAGTIVADDLQHSTAGSVGTEYVVNGSAKAWCYISSSGTVVSDSLNVGSVTDNGVGNYQPNFSSNMSNATFNTTTTSGNHATSHNCSGFTASNTTSRFLIRCANGAESAVTDLLNTYGLIHGDLA